MTEQTDAAEVARANLAAIMHELETPMRGHDEDGRCCLLAALAAQVAPSRVPGEGS
jgi:hypothetical protein